MVLHRDLGHFCTPTTLCPFGAWHSNKSGVTWCGYLSWGLVFSAWFEWFPWPFFWSYAVQSLWPRYRRWCGLASCSFNRVSNGRDISLCPNTVSDYIISWQTKSQETTIHVATCLRVLGAVCEAVPHWNQEECPSRRMASQLYGDPGCPIIKGSLLGTLLKIQTNAECNVWHYWVMSMWSSNVYFLFSDPATFFRLVPLPTFSPYVIPFLKGDEPAIERVWSCIIDQAAEHYTATGYPEIRDQMCYRVIGEKMLAKYPTLGSAGKQPWVSLFPLSMQIFPLFSHRLGSSPLK